jgi:SAM-dependent methyltransferase
MTIDFGRTATDYARHRAGFPDAFFERLLRDEVKPGDRVLDLGSGTGTVARGLALRGCRVTALDPSAELLAQARDLDAQAGVEVLQVVSRVEDAHFTPESFEVVVAGQCWHWFERPEAARRARNWLVPGGRLVIAHFDWLPLAGNMVEDTESLIHAWNPGWKMGGGSGLYPAWLKDVREAGFTALRTFSFDLDVPYSHEDWRGRIRASAGVGASLDPEAIKRFDDELATLLAAKHGEQPMRVPHRVWALVANA